MKKVLLLAVALIAFANLLQAQQMGNYPTYFSVKEGGAISITPTSPPSGVTYSIANTQAVNPAYEANYPNGIMSENHRRSFLGNLTVNPTTGELRITNAKPSGIYNIIMHTPSTIVYNENLNNPAYNYISSGTGVKWGIDTTLKQSVNPNGNCNASYQALKNGCSAAYIDNADGALTMMSDISLVGMTNPKLTFSQIVKTEVGYDFCSVEYSTNGGLTWVAFPSSAYRGAGTLATTASVNGKIAFDGASYPAPYNNISSSFAGLDLKNESIDLSAYTSYSTFRVRFRLTSDASVIGKGWALDNISFYAANYGFECVGFEGYVTPNPLNTTGTGISCNNIKAIEYEGAPNNNMGQCYVLKYGNNANGSLEMNSDISLVGQAAPELTFTHLIMTEPGRDFGTVEYSTNGGLTWSAFSSSAFRGQGTLATTASVNGTIAFDANSNWLLPGYNDQYYFGTQYLFQRETIDLSAFTGYSTFRVRFRLTSDDANIWAGWALDNITIGNGKSALDNQRSIILNVTTPQCSNKFEAPVSYNTEGSSCNNCTTGYAVPNAIAVADFNKDGNKDLVIINRGVVNNGSQQTISSIVVEKGDGLGGYVNDWTLQSSYYGATFPMYYTDVAVADVNGDGNEDIVVTSEGSTSSNTSAYVVVYLGRANGSFIVPALNYPATSGARNLSIEDINFDGKNDIIYRGSGNINVMLNNGSSSNPFTSGSTKTSSASPIAGKYLLTDYNQDGAVDLVYGTSNNGYFQLIGLQGYGNGGFSPYLNSAINPANIVYSEQNTGGSSGSEGIIKSLDYNKDEILDYVYATMMPNGVISIKKLMGAQNSYRRLSWSKDYEFQYDLSSVTSISQVTKVSSMEIGDFNGDGETDLAITWDVNQTNQILIVYGFGLSNGKEKRKIVSTGGINASQILSGDFNSDGILDVLTINSYSDNFSLLKGKAATVAEFTPIITQQPILLNSNSNSICDGNYDNSTSVPMPDQRQSFFTLNANVSVSDSSNNNFSVSWYKKQGNRDVLITNSRGPNDPNELSNQSRISAILDRSTNSGASLLPIDSVVGDYFFTIKRVYKPTYVPTPSEPEYGLPDLIASCPVLDTIPIISNMVTITKTLPTVPKIKLSVDQNVSEICPKKTYTISAERINCGSNPEMHWEAIFPSNSPYYADFIYTWFTSSAEYNGVMFLGSYGFFNCYFRCYIIIKDECSTDGDFRVYSDSIYVGPQANPKITLEPENNMADLCSGETKTLKAVCDYCTPTTNYTFYKDNSNIQQSASATVTTNFLPPSNSIKVTADANSCTEGSITSETLVGGNFSNGGSNSWGSITSLNNTLPGLAGKGLQNGFSFTIGNKVYFGGCESTSGLTTYNYYLGFWSFDVLTQVTKYYGQVLPYESNQGFAFSSNGKGYILFGKTISGTQSITSAFYEFDPVTGYFTDKSTALIGTDLNNCSGMSGFTINDFGYVGGGAIGGVTGSTKWYKYDPINSRFYSISDCPVTSITNKIGVGFSISGKGYFLKDGQLWKFDPSFGNWTNTLKGFPNSNQYQNLSAFSIDNYAYIGGGFPSTYTQDYNTTGQRYFYEFNGFTESYTTGLSSMSYPGVAKATGFSIGNKGYILGGVSNANPTTQGKFEMQVYNTQYSQKTVFPYGIPSSKLCKGSSFSLKYDGGCASAPYPSDNVFTAELSDKNGVFVNPTVIGRKISSAVKGTITVSIPSSIEAGTRYRIRVNASSPKTIGLDNDKDIIIGTPESPGSITHDYSIPSPTELAMDSVKNIELVQGAIIGYFWQKSSDTVDASNWRSITDTSVNRSSYALPNNYNNDVFIRRGAALSCLASIYTNPVSIRVYSASNGRLNGSISGYVKSSNGVGVYGVPVYAQKTSALLGSPQSKIYQATTDLSGAYTIPSIFYGDLNNGDPASVVFKVWPALTNHGFTPDTLLAELSNVINTARDKNFTDTSAYSVKGKVMQYCDDCDLGFRTDSLIGVEINITKGGLSFPSANTTDEYGRYGTTFTDPGSYKFVPRKTGNTFTPVERTVNIVNSDLAGLDFTNTTKYNISGLFRAGANEVIGRARLVFSDTMVPARFKKTIYTNDDGTYSVSLPARTYNITVIDFIPNVAGNDILPNDLLAWFNTIQKDSLKKISIDGSSKTVDLIYHRIPKLYVTSLTDTSCGNYAVFKQEESRTFLIKVYEGDASHHALLSYDTVSSISLSTNLQQKSSSLDETLTYRPVNSIAKVTLIGGAPNIVSPYNKTFRVDFTDKYDRMATTLVRNVKVLGLKSDPSTFTTVSPSVPILILHAPPGDQSTSFWEQNRTTESAMSFSSLSDKSTNKWVDVKLGTQFSVGIGFQVETSIWANSNTSITNSQRVTNAREAIISSSTSVSYATEPNGGDVYVGGAINMAYAISNELLFRSDTTDGCLLGLKSSLAIAPKGFATTYTYSESFITDNLIPRLQLQAVLNPDSTKVLLNQVSIWQQVIANNNANKGRASFVRNRSFDGNAGPITESTTSSSTNTNTIAFEMEIDRSIAAQAGIEIQGSGISGGATIDMKMTTGSSTTNTTTTSTTMGYTLDDDDAGDFYSVDIKKDPVYNTPVFVLVAGTASCPAEPIAQSRDLVQLSIPTPEIRNIPANGEALFQLQLENISQSRETRTYYLSFNQSSNPNGALVTIGGSPVTSNISYTIPYLGSQTVTISVRKSNASPVFSYEGLQFTLSDACDGGVSESKTISAYFISPCSDLVLSAPVNNWIVKSSDNNILPVEFTGYNLSNLQSVSLEYAHAGRGDWRRDTIVYQNLITNPTTTVLNWNTRGLVDGEYDIRMKLNCSFGSGYTQRLTGIIDREAPILFGHPKPTNGIYANGDEISMSYTENIGTTNLNIDKVRMTRLSNGADIPVQVSGYQNKLMIMPLVNINTFASGEAIRVITKNIADVYGNTSTVFDTLVFTIGTSVATPTTRQVKISNQITSKRSVYENSGDSLQVRFSIPTASTYNTVVHYIVSGNAEFDNDYTNTFSSGQNLTTSFNGVEGTINIPANATWAVLNIKPIADDDIESNETVTIRLLSGGDYTLGADSTSVLTDSIKNDDITKPEVTLGELSTTSPTGYCATVTDNSLAKTYVWNVPETLPTGYCETATNNTLIRPYVWNVPTTLPAGYCDIQTDYSLLKTNSTPPVEIPNTMPEGYCYAEAPNNGDEQIYSVSFGSMNNVQSDDCTTSYTDYSATISAPTVLLGDVIPFSVNTDECDAAPYYPSGLSIYLDYNRDGDFDDAGEQAYTTNETMMSPNIRSGNIQIPTTATRGLTKMRVVMSESNPSPASCGNMGHGEVEDYAVVIDSAPSILPVLSIFDDEQIFAVSFGTMNNTQTENCSTNYTDYSENIVAPVVTVGETVPFSVLTDECDVAPYFASGMSVFIDYNRDGDFDDANEQAYTTSATTMSPNTRSGNIVIPVDAAEGLTKMRIIVAEGVTSPGSCMNIGYGEVEDYSIMIHGIPPAQSIYEDQQIKAVSFGSMNNTQSDDCSANYTDYTTTVAAPIVTLGTYVPFSVFTDECDAAPYYASGMSIFIDYNRDGDFEDFGELASTYYGTSVSPNTRSGYIYIPTDATQGLTKMRVVVQDGVGIPSSCPTLGYGEVEDYAIMIHGVEPVLSVTDDEQIKSVGFGTMENLQSDNCNSNYTDYSSTVLPPVVSLGESVPFSVLTDDCDMAPYYASGMSIFIDYNRDGDFNDAGEKAYTTNGTTMSPNTRSGLIEIPASASVGVTKMRIVVAEGVASPEACTGMGYGEVEDYNIMIKNSAPPTICQGGTGTLYGPTSIDGHSIYLYVWKLNGTLLNANTRIISINTPGTYTLKVYTNNGFSSLSMPYVVTATAPPTSHLYETICPSQLPYSWNGNNYTSTGNYSKMVSNANGCDSIAYLHLVVKSNSYAVETISAIDTYEWHGTVYDASTNTAIWTGVNAAGCDSIVTLNLTIIPICVPVERVFDIIACNSYTWHGIRFTNSVTGIEWTTLNYRGCDSTEILNLTIKRSSTSTTNVTVCASQMPYLWNNTIYSTAGTFTKRFNNAAGCDSTARLVLTVNAVSSSTTNVSVCANDMPYTWNDIVYNTGGSFTQTFTNAKGCDSTSTLVLTIKPVSNSSNSLSICSSQLPLNWNGLTLTATGTYSASFNNIYGCDSIVVLNLTVKEVSNVVETIAATGSSYNWHGTTFTASNYTATWVGINAAGCDSIVTLNLTLTNDCVPTESILNVTACNVYFWRGIRLTTSTTLEWIGVNAGGCDSVEILNLTITNVSPSASPATITQTLVSNVCGARVYRYTAAAVTNAVGYNWTLPISVGGISGVVVDSGVATNSRVILVRYASTLAAFTTDSVKVKAFSPCGTTGNRSAKLLNTLFTVPTAPATITITPIVTNICGAKRYRYTAPSLPVATTTAVGATGYIWAFRGVLGASIDSGSVNSKVITVTFSSNAAAATGDSIKLAYSSSCGNSLFKASKFTNTLISAPLSPTVTVTPVQTNVCGARKYRYTASALVAATTTAGAATGWLWSLPAEGTVGSTGVLDSGSIGSQTIVVVYTSNAAAAAGDTIRVAYTSACGLSVAKATKLTNTALDAPLAPATVTITPLVTNICGARKYRYTAAGLIASTTTATAASGWLWTLPAEGIVGSTGVLDSGSSVSSQTIVVVYSSNAAAIAGDSIRVRYTSGCGLGATKATKLTNTLLGAPLAPATITIATVSDICGARVYRYTAPALAIATTTAGAAKGYLWSMPTGTLGLTGVLDSGSLTSKVIKIRYSSNAAALTGDSIKVLYTSDCGNSPAKAQKLSNLAPTLLAASATLTGTTSICSAVGTSTSNRYIASAVTGALSYVWTLPAGAVLDSGSNGLRIKVRFLTAGANDSIFVQAVGTNGCAGTKKVLKLVTTGCVTQLISRTIVPSTIKTSIDPMKINVYPNPTTNTFQMFVKTPTASKITMRVLDVQGRLIKTISFNSDETIAFGNDLKSGVYMVEVREGNVVKTVRVVKY